jgi:hypothetical protein
MVTIRNVYVNDEVGRKYRIPFHNDSHPLGVFRKCLSSGGETALKLSGKKAKRLIAVARAHLAKEAQK